MSSMRPGGGGRWWPAGWRVGGVSPPPPGAARHTPDSDRRTSVDLDVVEPLDATDDDEAEGLLRTSTRPTSWSILPPPPPVCMSSPLMSVMPPSRFKCLCSAPLLPGGSGGGARADADTRRVRLLHQGCGGQGGPRAVQVETNSPLVVESARFQLLNLKHETAARGPGRKTWRLLIHAERLSPYHVFPSIPYESTAFKLCFQFQLAPLQQGLALRAPQGRAHSTGDTDAQDWT